MRIVFEDGWGIDADDWTGVAFSYVGKTEAIIAGATRDMLLRIASTIMDCDQAEATRRLEACEVLE